MAAQLPRTTPMQHYAVFINHPQNRHEIAGAKIVSIDEIMGEIRSEVQKFGKMSRNAIAEQYPLLRTLQLSHNAGALAFHRED
jgi:hypothetical protein